MKEFFKMIKRWDLIMILLFIGLSFLPLAIFSYNQAKNSTANATYTAVISVNNQVVKEIPLSGHQGTDVFEIKEDDTNYNIVEVIDEHIHIKSANCRDQVCVRTKAISKPGQTIVCLPHQLIIEIQSTQQQSDEEMIISS